jgi:glutamate N-acetyltransferase/amino-acid N-acetyltransferase
MKKIDGGITAVQGFRAAGVVCGIKKDEAIAAHYGGNAMDLALIVCDEPATAAGVFTPNKAKAAPVIVSQEHVKNGKAQAIVANSGNPNACTGEQGLRDAKRMTELVADELKIDAELVLVGSTGRIGVPMPMDKVEKGIKLAAGSLSRDGGRRAARAIMTTDTFPKEIALEFDLQGKKARIGGMVKGAGMIEPNMATMLCFMATDVSIDRALLQDALKAAVDRSFNMISVDGDMSTNDTAVILASGKAGNDRLANKENSDYASFLDALSFATLSLAKMIVKDGEGATKFVEVRIKGAQSCEDARIAAHAIARSPLVKTAMFGEDPNWGRFMSSLGASGIEMDGSTVDIWLGDVKVAENSVTTGLEEQAKQVMKEDEFVLTIDLKVGEAEATLWTCDLSYDYVKCNI